MMSSNYLPLFLLVASLLTSGLEAQRLEATAETHVKTGESESYEIPAELGTTSGEEQTWKPFEASRQVSQRQMLRSLRERKRRQGDSVKKDDFSERPTVSEALTTGEAMRVNFHEVKESIEIPAEQLADFVEKLPGQPPVDFAQYAGYVTVNEIAGRALFYWFVEATSSPETKPLVLWLNGGPGCSSLGYGAFEELGPFRVKSDGATLYRNHYAWNKLANFLFVESPAGVGFSYSNTSSDYFTSGDTRTAADSLTFLLKWIERFPQYKFRDFFITGESYAGNYVPQLTKLLYEHNKQLTVKPFFNLKGFLVGNAVIDDDQDSQGTIDYWWTHAIISDETYVKLQRCGPSIDSTSCGNVVDASYDEQGNIDPYDIYTPACLTPTANLGRHKRIGRRFKGYDPCIDNYVTAYLNRPDVQKALHANVTHVSFPWTPCSDPVNLNYQDSATTVIPIYKELIAAGLKIWVISGDVDSVVPVIATRYSLHLLKLKTTVPWYAWYRSKQVGGYTQGYDGLTFVTVRDAGHEVPLFQPARALTLITSYLTGVPLPRS